MRLAFKMKINSIFNFLILTLVFGLPIACNEDNKLEAEIAKIDINFNIERFDEALQNAEVKDLLKLKTAYPFLFSKHTPDSVWVKRMQDTLQHELLAEVQKKFSNLEQEKEDLTAFFQHLKYYDKTFKTPRVITLTNHVDYRDKTIVTDSLLLIALDNFLGKAHYFYEGIPKYIAANLEPNQIVSNIAENYAKQYVQPTKRKTFLDEMLYFGKLLYFKDVMLPNVSDAEKMGYTPQQIAWATENEPNIWSYFVENELLYSTDAKLVNRFIANAPFSKFYLNIDNDSPGRLGQYIGWQIVKAYAKNNNENVFSILQKSTQELFNNSKFKPKK